MLTKAEILEAIRDQGKIDALDLAARAADMTGTEIIAEESKVPAWREDAVYTADHVGKPVRDGEQVYIILMPHTPAHNPGSRPADLPAIYSPCHTTDPKRAKPYVAPNGISGRYAIDECCTEDGHVWRNKYENNEFPPSSMPERWDDLGTIEEAQI